MWRALLLPAGLVIVGYAALCGVFFVKQRSYLYYPTPRAPSTAETLRLPIDGGDVLFTTRPHVGPDAVLYFGGNAEAVADSLPDLAAAFPQHALYLMHYRGYSGSSGTPSEAALVADALALYEHVQREHSHIVVIGRSLGSGVAIQVASARPVTRLVLVTPFESVQSLAAKMLPYLPVRWLLRDRYESGRHAPQVRAPTLVLAAENDEVIPRWSTDALVQQFAPGIVSYRVIAGVGHNTISASADYVPALAAQ